MKRFYSPDTYCAAGACINDLLSQKVRSSQNIQSSISLSNYHSPQLKKIGRYYYNQLDQIGRGYTSKVYRAYAMDQSNSLSMTNQPYAIKVISLSKSTPSSLELLQNQIEILKMLDHPNIIKCYDIYKSKTHCYIVTEYCPGGCLMTYLNKNNKKDNRKLLNQQKVINIVQQIVQGLKYLQLKGVVHRDIKPANILKGKSSWKIADFGFSIKSNCQFKCKFNVGTPLYMPVQSLTQNLYSPQTDIFSIGIILYEMLTGTTPWQSKSQKQLIKKMELIPLQKTISKNKISPSFFSLIQKMCSLRKKNRMSNEQFMNLQISQFIKEKSKQNPEAAIIDYKQELISVKSEIFFKKKLRQNRSMDQIQIQRQKQNLQQKPKRFITGSMIFEKQQKIQDNNACIPDLNKNLSVVQSINKQKQANDLKQLKSYDSKKQIYWSIKDKYYDIPLTIKSTNLKKSNPTQPYSKYLLRASERIQLKSQYKKQDKRQDNTRSTQTKQEQTQFKPLISSFIPLTSSIKFQNNQTPKIQKQTKFLQQMTHIFLNQIHFCRFLFYLHKNLLYILLSKKSQQKLSMMIFRIIFETLNEVQQIEIEQNEQKIIKLLNIDRNKLEIYLKSDKHQVMKKTTKQYKQKYQKQFSLYKIKIGRFALQELENEQKNDQNLITKSLKNKDKQTNLTLKYVQKQLRILLKQYDQNLLLTIDSLNMNSIAQIHSHNIINSPRYNKSNQLNGYKPNGFISANMQGLKNMYQFYRLINILLEYNKNWIVFQNKSKIKVNTDYTKNNITSSQLDKIRQLIRLL